MYRCPWCDGVIQVDPADIRCGIFRHAVFKATGEPIPPHASKAECDQWVAAGEVWGCGKPFRWVQGKMEKCDYI